MSFCIFTNDLDVKINLVENHPFSYQFKNRDGHEVIFRKISSFLINNNIIKNNIIDLGAWIGDNSIPWAKNINSIVYAIDPSPDNCMFIQKMCDSNNITNIKIIQKAISDKNEKLSTDSDLHHCSFVYGNPQLNGINKVDAVSLDYLYDLKEIDNIGYIHLDVEGMEYRVLVGADKIIGNFRPIIAFEQHLYSDKYQHLSEYISKKKYRVYMIEEVLPGCAPDCRNFISFPEEIITDTFIENLHNHLNLKCLQLQTY